MPCTATGPAAGSMLLYYYNSRAIKSTIDIDMIKVCVEQYSRSSVESEGVARAKSATTATAVVVVRAVAVAVGGGGWGTP